MYQLLVITLISIPPYTVSRVKLSGGFLTLGWAKLSLLPFLIEDSASYQMFFTESINKLHSQSYAIFNLLKYMYCYIMNLYFDCDLLKMLNFGTKNDTPPTFFSQRFETWQLCLQGEFKQFQLFRILYLDLNPKIFTIICFIQLLKSNKSNNNILSCNSKWPNFRPLAKNSRRSFNFSANI